MSKIISGGDIKQWPTKSFVHTVFSVHEQFGDQIFLEEVKTKNKYSFNDFHRETCKMAVKFKEHGIGPGHLVSILGDNSFYIFTVYYGITLTGASVSPINQTLTPDEVSKMIEGSKPSIIYCDDDKFIDLIEKSINMTNLKPKILTRAKLNSIVVNDENLKNFKPPEIKDSYNHIYVVLFTSGTTGIPKAVQLRDRATLTQLNCVNWAFGKFLLTSPLFWISNCMLTAKSLLTGFTIVLPDIDDAERYLQIVQEFKVQSWFGGPSILLDACRIESEKHYDLSSLQFIFTGGSKILKEHKNAMRKYLLNGRPGLRIIYGATEAGVISEWKSEIDPESREYESIGQPIEGVQLKIVNTDTNEIVGAEEEGEICVKSPNIMAGYMNVKTEDLDSDGWWHLGDIGYYDKNGFIYYVSRLKDIFKYRGIQIAPSEIENVILKHGDVADACVVGKPHLIDGEWPTAFVILKPNAKATDKDIEEFVTANVPDSKKLRGGVHLVEAFPRNAVGKILTKDLIKSLQ
ncbi:hypothetical protein O3M35_004408 [Rhynocoris fuscipes]|uniref:Luciferin 4-monooxygenase n=1 Tax=Rhynocoris fuscipes TaxID=488301 RepID=A0AAW1CG63_9HEMI